MSAFRFQLDPLLRHRQRQEDQCRRDLATLQRQKLDAERRLMVIHHQIEREKQYLATQLQGAVPPGAIRAHAATVGLLHRKAQQIVYELAESARQIEQARTRLLEASKQRKSIARLRELRYEAWQRDARRAEQFEFDDLINSRWAGANAGTGELTNL
ncbi:MAG: flagellar export protein FliJ [Planctomycetes bacterium]|nr:flagellar export protein FliJ [Planctomycetota bacterium]NOG53590.1 flagellar export protein FliJ [Planctomycetota bacterium]